jgi:hypothetical protein
MTAATPASSSSSRRRSWRDHYYIAEARTMTELFSIRDVARRLGVAAHQICYAHVQGKLPEPKFWVAGKRVYTTADLRRISAYFARKPGRRTKAKHDDASAGSGI